MNRLPVIVRQHIAAFRALLVFTVLCGLIYPAVMVGFSQVAFHHQANGSTVSYNGRVVGSGLLCQEFADAKGNPLPQYFQPRPSNAVSGAKNDYGCNPLFSAATNLGPSNPKEIAAIQAQQKAIAAFDHVSVSQIPPDAVTASASGLDPGISPQNAAIQVDRVAAARHLPVSEVQALVATYTQGRALSFLGEPTVNVLELNIALDQLSALAVAASHRPDAIILDLGLPDIDGTEVIVELRRWYHAPIIVLSGRTSPGDKIGALDVGADDYVTKPFAMAELLARLRAALRRDEGDASLSQPRPAVIGQWLVDLAAHQVKRAGSEDGGGADGGGAETLRLTPTEWRILEMLLRRPGQLVGSAQILTAVWGSGFQQRTNYLRFHMARLRHKLEDNPARPRHLLTEPGMGYRYQP